MQIAPSCTELHQVTQVSTVRRHKAGLCKCNVNYANGGCLTAKVKINYAKGREYRKTCVTIPGKYLARPSYALHRSLGLC